MSIDWQDKSDARATRYVYDAGAMTVDVARWRPGEIWLASIGYMDGRSWRIHAHGLDALLCDDDAKARALVDALAIMRALVRIARDDEQALAVAVAGARLGA